MPADPRLPLEGPDEQRLDAWLDVACLFKTRSQAQAACKAGKVSVDGSRAKPHRLLRRGEELQITRPGGWKQIVVVRRLAEHHLPKATARQLYDDHTPAPSPEELEMRRLTAAAGLGRRAAGAGAPKKKDRRAVRKLTGR